MSLKRQLLELQWKQLQHDENYHKDIWLLTVHHRVNHMVLHFAKYNGQLAQALNDNDNKLFSKTCLDALIIATSFANILNVNLATELSQYEPSTNSIDSLSLKLANEADATTDSISRNIAINVGKLAKAAESIDHLEKFTFRETLSCLVVDMFKTTLIGSAIVSNDKAIIDEIESRMLTVERKSMFFEKLGNYKDGY